MGLTIAQKIIKDHLVSGDMKPGSEIGIRIDQTLTQDATGTFVYLEFESMGIKNVHTELSVAYIDHNMLQSGFENADDHRYIQSVAKKYGIWFSRAGNGICHQLHLERMGIPGKTLIGSDSHTPTAGALGELSFGAGGMDVANAMGGGAYFISMPRMIKVELSGTLRPFVSAEDISLEILRRLTVKGGVGAIIEWGGKGIKGLSVPERATITNMGAELGATSSIFPSDEVTRAFLKAQGREGDFKYLQSDPDATYDSIIHIDLDSLEPLIACPHSPDNVVSVASLKDVKVNQVCIGSCTNSSFVDMMKVAALLRGRTIAENVSLSISPGSRQVLTMLSQSSALCDILNSGARLLECACGPCIGMGFSPGSGEVSVRTFNRNFEGRSGTADALIYLASPETAVASALNGVITDPKTLGESPVVTEPKHFFIENGGFIPPADVKERNKIKIIRGPNIKKIPDPPLFTDTMELKVSLKVGDNITTDHIMPAGSRILPFRSNIPYLSDFCFTRCDPHFPKRAKSLGQSIIVGGLNYGQGSSREHAALVPLYLGVRAVIVKSFARIHLANLINAGILPLTFADFADYESISEGDLLKLENISGGLDKGKLLLNNLSKDRKIVLYCTLSNREKKILKAGGLLSWTRKAKFQEK